MSHFRIRALNAFRSLLPDADAMDLEYTCYMTAILNHFNYDRPFLQIYSVLQNDASFSGSIRRLGAAQAIAELKSRPDANLEEFLERRQEEEKCEQILRSLSKNDTLDDDKSGIRCGRCRSTAIVFQFRQMRSADEGTTCFCTCEKCGKRWKLS